MNTQRGSYLAILFLLVIAVGCTVQTDESLAPDDDLKPPRFLSPFVDAAAKAIEMVGIGIIIIGAMLSSILFVREWAKGQAFIEVYRQYRERLGQAILLGLEFLVAADIIGTVAVDPTFRNIGILGAIVSIRTFLSFALEVEIRGRWPWASEGP